MLPPNSVCNLKYMCGSVSTQDASSDSAARLAFNGPARRFKYTISDLTTDRLCRIACSRCGRQGAYRRETLTARFGDATALPDVLIALTASPRRDYSHPCGALYVNPPGATGGASV